MQVQRVQNNNATFGTRFDQRFIEELEKTVTNNKINSNINKNIKKMLNDGLDDICIGIKTVDNFWSGKNTEVFYVQSNKLEQLAQKAKDDRELYRDEQYYKALRYLKQTAQIDRRNRDKDLCDVKSINGQNYFLLGSNDNTSSMIYALIRQTGRNVNVSVDGMETRVKGGSNDFWYVFRNKDFADKFKTIYNEVVRNYEILINRLDNINKFN